MTNPLICFAHVSAASYARRYTPRQPPFSRRFRPAASVRATHLEGSGRAPYGLQSAPVRAPVRPRTGSSRAPYGLRAVPSRPSGGPRAPPPDPRPVESTHCVREPHHPRHPRRGSSRSGRRRPGHPRPGSRPAADRRTWGRRAGTPQPRLHRRLGRHPAPRCAPVPRRDRPRRRPRGFASRAPDPLLPAAPQPRVAHPGGRAAPPVAHLGAGHRRALPYRSRHLLRRAAGRAGDRLRHGRGHGTDGRRRPGHRHPRL